MGTGATRRASARCGQSSIRRGRTVEARERTARTVDGTMRRLMFGSTRLEVGNRVGHADAAVRSGLHLPDSPEVWPPPYSRERGCSWAPTAARRSKAPSGVLLSQLAFTWEKDAVLLVSDGASSLTAALPAPACVRAASPFRSSIAVARAALPGAGEVVTVDGVGFIDPGGRVGLHPILAICAGRDCQPPSR